MTIDVELAERCAGFATEQVELFGIVRTTMRLPSLSAPYVVIDYLSVGNYRDKPLAVLTIPSGTVMKFKQGTRLWTGGYFPGAIVAHGATFTSAEPEPRPGDWSGINVGYDGRGDFDDDTFEYAGMDGWPALISSMTRRGLDIRNSRFRRNAGPGIGDSVSCAKWKTAGRKNVFEDQPACVRNKR